MSVLLLSYIKVGLKSTVSILNLVPVLCYNSHRTMLYRLCILLLTRDIRGDDAYRDSFRDYVRLRRDKDTAGDRVTFGYVYEDAQSTFVNSLTLGQGIKNETLGTLKVTVFIIS